jgi:hypothetical protein
MAHGCHGPMSGAEELRTEVGTSLCRPAPYRAASAWPRKPRAVHSRVNCLVLVETIFCRMLRCRAPCRS